MTDLALTVSAYLILLGATAWFSAYARHLRETAALIEEKISPLMPSGTRFHIPRPWYVQYGIAENALLLCTLAFGVLALPARWALGGFGIFLFVLHPISTGLLTPRPGGPHFMALIQKFVQSRLERYELEDNRTKAELLRIGLERIEKGL